MNYNFTKKILTLFAALFFTTMLLSQAAQSGRLYFSSAYTGRIYDITTLNGGAATGALPASVTGLGTTSSFADQSSLAVGFEANASGGPFYFNANVTANQSFYKNGTATGVRTVTAVSGLGINNVPGTFFGITYGNIGGAKSIRQMYPSPAATNITFANAADATFTGGTPFGFDGAFDYENNIFQIIQNGTNYYLYKMNLSTQVATQMFQINTTTNAMPGAAQGIAYLNGKIYLSTISGTSVQIRSIDFLTKSVSGVLTTYTGLSPTANSDLGSVDYFLPFTFNCGSASFLTSNPYIVGTSSTRTLRIPISNVYYPGTYTINVNGTNITNPAYQATITTASTFIDVPVTYDGGGASGTRTIIYDLNGSTTTCSLPAVVDVDSDGDGVGDTVDLDDDNDGILDTTEGQCINTSNPSTDGFDSPSVTTVNGNNIQSVNPYNGWGTETGGANAFNVIRVNGAGYSKGPDVAQSGTQYIDINASSTYVYKDIILTTPTVFSASAWFANRESSNGGYAPWSTKIEIRNETTGITVAQGNTINFTSSISDEIWNNSSINSVALPAGTYRIRMFVGDFGHLDSISYCFSKDTDGDGTPNYLDTDSDGDTCPDAVEGSENVSIEQVWPLHLPIADANYANRGKIKVIYDGITTNTQPNIVSQSAAALGVPQLVNNAGNNLNSITNPSDLAGLADNTDVPGPTTADIGQGVGASTNAAINACICYNDPNTGTVGADTKHGITLLKRAGATPQPDNWPMERKSAFTALESNTKGFVITRMTTAEINALTGQSGMMVYDTNLKCLKLFDGAAWSCFNTPTCP
ncbi:hypothetical protein SAMN05421789_10197 [Kaistella chaponensis]|uniref:Uncharacterized protein n=2 Tax=Kaistella chaponensis TaxID=713588 RepID=A0A1N7J509_9FLAO|nr:hypothetical protein SAMN05421789_10197 [Kaistella chaponensis]